jgi:MFS family permease
LGDILLFIPVKFPPLPVAEQAAGIKKMLSGVFKNGQFIKLVAFVTIWMFSVNLSGPFYLVYARNGIGLSNTAITFTMQILPGICSISILTLWGKLMDSRGYKPIMAITSRISVIAALTWCFVVPGPFSVPLIIVASAVSGLTMAGLDISVQNTLIHGSPEKNRSMYVAAYFCITSLIGAGLSNTAGGWLLDNALPFFETLNLSLFGRELSRYNYLFVISFVMRLICVFVLLPRMVPGKRTENI